MNWNWVLVIGGALMILAEVVLGGFAGFDLVLIGTAFVLGGGIGFVVGNPVTGLIASSVLCILYIVAGRKWVRSRIHMRHVASGTDALVGLQGVVLRRIDVHDPGQIRVRDEQWRARPVPGTGPFEEGALVTVQSVDGVTLLVR
jgi:membrane protein implicated in regulation of membrane protease activity